MHWTAANLIATQVPESVGVPQWSYPNIYVDQGGLPTRMPKSNPGNGTTGRFYEAKHFGSLPQQSTRRNKITGTSKTNLYVSGLQESDNDETVRALVEGVIVPKSSKAMMSDGKCKGSGFIDCATEEDAEKGRLHIIEMTNRNGKKLTVKYAFENEKDTLNVYVRNLPRANFSDEKLRDLFKPYGQITSVKLLESSPPSGGPTGTGFVRFASAEQAAEAVDSMNAQQLVLAEYEKPVSCKLADKTDPRKKTSRNSPELNGNGGPLLMGQQNSPALLAYQNGASGGANGYIPTPMYQNGAQNGHPMLPTGAQTLPTSAQFNPLVASMQALQLQNAGAVVSTANISPHQMALQPLGNSVGNGVVPATSYNPAGQSHTSPVYYQAYQGPAGGAYSASPLASSNMMPNMYPGAYMMPGASYMPPAAQAYLASMTQGHAIQQNGCTQQQHPAEATHYIPQQQPYAV